MVSSTIHDVWANAYMWKMHVWVDVTGRGWLALSFAASSFEQLGSTIRHHEWAIAYWVDVTGRGCG